MFYHHTFAFLMGSRPELFNLLEDGKGYSISPSLKSYGSSPFSRSDSTSGCSNNPKVWMCSFTLSSEILNLLCV